MNVRSVPSEPRAGQRGRPWYEGSVVLLLALSLAAPALPAGRWYESPAGYGLRLPPGFAADPTLPLGPSAAAAPAQERARIDAAFSDVAAGGHTSLLVSQVEGSLPEGSFAAGQLGTLVLDYLRDALGAPDPKLEWIDRVPTADGRVYELAGRFLLYGEERVVQMAFVPDGTRYFVVAASLPKARFADQGPQFEAALASFRLTHPARGRLERTELGALAGALLGLAVALFVRQRRSRSRSLGA